MSPCLRLQIKCLNLHGRCTVTAHSKHDPKKIPRDPQSSRDCNTAIPLSTRLHAFRISALECQCHPPSEYRFCVQTLNSRARLQNSLMLCVASSSSTAASDKRGPSLKDTCDAGRFSTAPSDPGFPMARENQWYKNAKTKPLLRRHTR